MFVCDVRRHLDLVCIPITVLIEIFSYVMALLQLKVIIINHSSSSVRDENDKLSGEQQITPYCRIAWAIGPQMKQPG